MPETIDICPVDELPPGAMRLVEWEDLEIGVFNCAGELFAIEDRCSHDDGDLVEGELDEDDLHRRVPAPRLALRPAHRKAPEPACLRARRHLPGVRRGRRDQAGGRLTMATPEVIAEQQALVGINADYEEKFGFHDPETGYAFKAPKGLDARARRADLRVQERAAVDARLPPEGARALPRAPAADLGLADAGRGRLRQHPLLRARLREVLDARGTTSPTTSRTRSTSSASPRPSASSSPASAPSTSPRSSTTRCARTSRSRASSSWTWTRALREHEDLVREYFATIIPSNDNKLAALNSAVWSGGSFVYVPPGVHVEMPLQAYFRINTENMGQFERTLIIADEGSYVHYVEGCTAPMWTLGLAALRGRRADRQAGRADPLHDRAELVAERLQPRHQARDRRDRRDGRVGRLQPRLQADDEVPERLPDGRARPRRGPLDRLRRQRPAPGRGRARSSTRRRTRRRTSSPSRSPRTAGAPPTAACSRSPRARTARKSKVVCDALLLDEDSRSDTYPTIRIGEDDVDVGHEASVSKIGEEQLFYLMSRGIPEEEAGKLIVNGFIEPIVKELPMEYAVEMNRLIELQMEGSIG